MSQPSQATGLEKFGPKMGNSPLGVTIEALSQLRASHLVCEILAVVAYARGSTCGSIRILLRGTGGGQDRGEEQWSLNGNPTLSVF